MNLQRIIDSAKKTGVLQLRELQNGGFPEELYSAETAPSSVKFYEAVPISKLVVANLPLRTLNWALLHNLFALKSVSLRSCGLDEFSMESEELIQLDISDNAIRTLPCLTQYRQLTLLRASGNPLREFRFCSEALVELELARCQLARCSLDCRNLTTVNLAENKLATIDLSECRAIRSANLRKNALSEANLGACVYMQTLDLSYNQLCSGPAECAALEQVCSLPALKELDCSFNRLYALPGSLFLAKTLEKVGFSDNNIYNVIVPKSDFWRTSKLQSIDLCSNALQEVPGELGLLQKLQKLTLQGNPMRKMSRIAQESNCEKIRNFLQQKLPLDHLFYQYENSSQKTRQERVIEAQLGRPASSDQQFTHAGNPQQAYENAPQLRIEIRDQEVPRSLLQNNVAAIKYLALERPSGFTYEVADALAQNLPAFAHLAELSMTQVPIESFSIIGCPVLQQVHIGQSLRLEGVHLIQCPCVDRVAITQTHLVDFVVSDCPRLAYLNLSQNQINVVSRFLLESTYLVDLNLSQNSIEGLSGRIFALTNLSVLNLAMNRLQYLPCELGLMAPRQEHETPDTRRFAGALQSLVLDGNYLIRPSKAVLKRGTASVLQWLRENLDVGSFLEKYALK